ncbi:hypothetical protein V6N11_018919 [Hibiscus sabdariffa]|uniref:Uncharacterized protein n=1 Tax=Hibiscus sabdariffa TaxID=183260 RepID=A0ABR2R0W8_9ROSI
MVLGVEFTSDALVLVNDDNTIRQCLGFLNSGGIVDLYVDHKNNYEFSEKSNEVGEVNENINDLVEIDAGNTLDVEDVTVVDDLGLTKGLGVEDTGGTEDTGRLEDTRGVVDIGDAIDTGGTKDTGESVAINLGFEIEDLGYDANIYDEVEETSDELRKTRQKRVSDYSEDEENNDVESQAHAFVENDTIVEEGLHEDNGKLEGNESDYLCSDDPGTSKRDVLDNNLTEAFNI